MTVSVAMCTYNGALYIEEQLRSILAQTVPVNEIVICDDGSTDTMIDILYRMQQNTTTCHSVSVEENFILPLVIKTPTMASMTKETKDALTNFRLRRAAAHKFLTCSSGLILV